MTKFHRGQRYQILPAYSQDGIVLSCVFQGSTDASVFEDFIKELLHHCGKCPEPKSVLVMDNASFHHPEGIEQICSQAGVKLVYLPPYSPDLNPIEELFAELKAFIRRHWQSYEGNPDQGFNSFLEWCIETVGAREQSAEEALCGLRAQYWLRRSVPQRQVFPVPADEYISFWCFTNLGTGIKGFDCLDEAAPIILKSQLLK